LRNICNELENKLEVKFTVIEEIAAFTSATGKLVEKISPIRIIESAGDYISAGYSVAQRVYKEKESNSKLT
jgi:hypothetical protein